MRFTIALSLSLAALACEPLPPRAGPPSSVDDLRIDDFRVVAAMGDSMTAGFNGGASADLKEHRGLGFSIGGDQGATTLPNLISAVKANGQLVGPARGTLSQPTVKAACREVDVCRLSAAVDGSDLQDLIDLQVSYLNHTLRTASWAANVSLERDWKLITIFSGLDDVVFYNTSSAAKQPTSPALFTANLDYLLESLHRSFPRTFVNLLLLPEHFTPNVTTSRLSCRLFKWYSSHVGIHWTDTKLWIDTIKEFNQIIIETAQKWKAKQLTDFAVSVQPMMRRALLAEADLDTMDCFHPNLASHRVTVPQNRFLTGVQGMALGLWNNMLADSFAAKSQSWKESQAVTCPTANSRLVV